MAEIVKVAIVQHRLLHYRVELFELLKDKLHAKNIELKLIHGKPSDTESKKNDLGKISWSTYVKNIYYRVKGVDILWQKLPSMTDHDLVILIQENRILSNYPTLLIRKILNKKTAFWGHGKNLQSKSPDGVREKWKTYWLNSVDWWFGYTQSTESYLVSKGFNGDRITTLNNAIDVKKFKALCDSVTQEDILEAKKQYGIPESSIVGVFCGSLYAEKRLELLKEACLLIKEKCPDFVLLVIGQGPDSHILSDHCAEFDWIKMVGVKTGIEKAVFFRMAKVMLNPGLVGLHILDSFTAGIPMVTTSDALHSPEYDYLIDGENGLVTEGSVSKYAEGVLKIFEDKELNIRLSSNALKASELYTVEQMAKNFSEGITKCLKL